MERWTGRVALVTGASSGIGRAVADRLIKNGIHVVAIARTIDQLDAIQMEFESENNPNYGRYKGVPCDLRDEEQIHHVFDVLRAEFGRVDLCLNIGGLAQNAPLINGSFEHWREMLEVNVLALSLITRESIKLMLERGIDDGHIVNMGSLSGHRVLTNCAIHFYAGTKFMVRALTEALRQELRDLKKNIRVSMVSPGLVETEFTSRMLDPERAKEIYTKSAMIQAEDVAQVILDLLRMPPHVEINDVLMRPTEQIF